MPQLNDLSRSLVALDQDSTIIAVVELSQSSWLVAGVLPGIERQPRKKLEPSAEQLLGVLHRWRDEAVGAGKEITRIALAFEAGRDGFWLARWLDRARRVYFVISHSSEATIAFVRRLSARVSAFRSAASSLVAAPPRAAPARPRRRDPCESAGHPHGAALACGARGA
jgi:hypothetical protein